MTTRFSAFVLCLIAASLFTFVVGCGGDTAPADKDAGADEANADDGVVDPHDVPITEEQKEELRSRMTTLPESVVVIVELRDAVEKETADGIPANPFEAHQALDKAEIVTQWLPEIAQQSEVPKEHWATVTTAANDLRELFDSIHLNIDNKVDPGFAAVKDKIDAAIEKLKSVPQQ